MPIPWPELKPRRTRQFPSERTSGGSEFLDAEIGWFRNRVVQKSGRSEIGWFRNWVVQKSISEKASKASYANFRVDMRAQLHAHTYQYLCLHVLTCICTHLHPHARAQCRAACAWSKDTELTVSSLLKYEAVISEHVGFSAHGQPERGEGAGKTHNPGGLRPPGRHRRVVGFVVRFRSALAGHVERIPR